MGKQNQTPKSNRASAASQPSAPSAASSGPAEAAAAPVERKRIVAVAIFVHGVTSGKQGGLVAPRLHEVPLMRRKLELLQERLELLADWPDDKAREREFDAGDLAEEWKRLKERYTFIGNDDKQYDLMTEIYGQAHEGRLVAVMRRMHDGLRAKLKAKGGKLLVEDLEELVALALPEADFIESPLET